MENLPNEILQNKKNTGKILAEKNPQEKKLPEKGKKNFYFKKWGLTKKDFKKWGKLGGRPVKYANDKERWKTYRRKKALKRIESGEIVGILNMTTGRVNKRKR